MVTDAHFIIFTQNIYYPFLPHSGAYPQTNVFSISAAEGNVYFYNRDGVVI